MAVGDSKSNFQLYYNPYSICSLMVLYTLAHRGTPKDAESEMDVATQIIDIFHEEQMSEHFLCNVNKYGQVPVLLNPAGHERPITDSLEMTLYVASRYPGLIPSQYKEEVQKFLTDLHALNYFSLSFPDRPQTAQMLVNAVQKRLDDPHISDRHRKALEFKKTIVQNDKVGGMAASETAKNKKGPASCWQH